MNMSSTASVRVRFAPSPTGHVHIGNIRAAIFNWLFARHEGGAFLLRVEDTDRERSTDEARQTLLDAMAWLRLDYDEPILSQSTRRDAHLEAAAQLEADGLAYRAAREGDARPAIVFRIPFATESAAIETVGPAALETHPETAVAVDHTGVRYALVSKKGKPVAEAGCLAGFKDLRLFDAGGACLFDLAGREQAVLQDGESFTAEGVVRMAFERRQVVFEDLVKGRLCKPLDGMKDLVIVRSNESPVFHLANVVDDAFQHITHIIRGDDHVENTFRHILLLQALGCDVPAYAHLPMIVNDQGKPYSKRDGDAYVGDFRSRGYDPDALFNYLSLLGWSPGDDREKMSRDELVAAFTLDRVRSSASQMDPAKLTHLNGRYLSEVPFDVFRAGAREAAARLGWGADIDEARFDAVCRLLQSRTNLYPDVAAWEHFFAELPGYDEKGVRKFLRSEGTAAALSALRSRVAAITFAVDALEGSLREVEQEHGIREGKLNQPVRVAVSGATIGAGLYETMVILGRERVLKRLDHAITLAQAGI